jgi:hypothetical protein
MTSTTAKLELVGCLRFVKLLKVDTCLEKAYFSLPIQFRYGFRILILTVESHLQNLMSSIFQLPPLITQSETTGFLPSYFLRRKIAGVSPVHSFNSKYLEVRLIKKTT